MRIGSILCIAALCATLAACANPINGCLSRPVACIVAGGAVTAGVIYLVKNPDVLP